MGFEEDPTSYDGILTSLEDVSKKQFMIVRNLSAPVIAKYGTDGLAVISAGFRAFGSWRGESMRIAPGAISGQRNALAILRDWDCGDLVMAALGTSGKIVGDVKRASLTLPSVLGRDQFQTEAELELLSLYWHETLKGIAQGYGEGTVIESHLEGLDGPWTITVKCPEACFHEGDLPAEVDSDILRAPERALTMVRNSSRNAGAVYMFVAREVIRSYDATGEQLVREGMRGFGRERGLALLDKHTSQNLDLNMKTLMNDWDGPLLSTWVFEDDGYLSEGLWHQDCLYCPYADVWSQYGTEGLNLGYLYDVEVHTALYQTYHPNAIVRWEKLKTRGDHVCRFHVSIPDYLQPKDPKFVPAR